MESRCPFSAARKSLPGLRAPQVKIARPGSAGGGFGRNAEAAAGALSCASEIHSRQPRRSLRGESRAGTRGQSRAGGAVVKGARCAGYGERGALWTASFVRAVGRAAGGALPLRRPWRELDVSRRGAAWSRATASHLFGPTYGGHTSWFHFYAPWFVKLRGGLIGALWHARIPGLRGLQAPAWEIPGDSGMKLRKAGFGWGGGEAPQQASNAIEPPFKTVIFSGGNWI